MFFEMLKKEGLVTLLSKDEASHVFGGDHPWGGEQKSLTTDENPWDADIVNPLPK